MKLRAPTRREFLGVGAAGLAALAFGLSRADRSSPRARRSQPPGVQLTVGVLLPENPAAETASFQRGAELAAREAERTAGLLKGRFALATARVREPVPDAAVGELLAGGARVIVGGISGPGAGAVMQAAAAGSTLYLNAAAADDQLRGRLCGAHLLHVAPSSSMRADAARRLESPIGNVTAWDSRLSRYGAEQLNDRYTAQYSAPMDEAAWCAWIATKIAWEAALRAPASDPVAMAHYLRASSAAFDGHKGVALRFDADGQLRQPLYARPSLAEVRDPAHAPHPRCA